MFVRFRVGIASSFARLVWPPADVFFAAAVASTSASKRNCFDAVFPYSRTRLRGNCAKVVAR